MEQNTNKSPDNKQGYDPTDRNFQRPNSDNEKINQVNNNESDDTVEDTDPPLTEQDLEENNLSDEEADNIEWDKPQ